MINSVYQKLLSVFSNSEKRNIISHKTHKALEVFIKYRFIILLIVYLVINPALFSNFIEKPSDLKAIACLIGVIVSVFILSRAIEVCFNNKRLMIYCFVYLGLMCHSGFDIDYFHSCMTVIALSLISPIVFKQRKFVFLLPLICFICEIPVPGFLTDYMIALLVICFLTSKEFSANTLSRAQKIFLSASAILFYFVSIPVSYYRNTKEISANPMLWQCFNDYFHFGFITRGLVATLRYIIIGPDTSFTKTFIFVTCLQIICLICIFCMTYYLWKKSMDNKYANFLCLALICSESFRNAADACMFVNFDNILFCCLLLCTILLIKDRYVVLIPILVSVAMLVHHGFGIFLFPALFIIMVYYYLSKDESQKSKILCLILVTVLAVLILFAYFQFHAHLNNKMTFPDACRYISNYVRHEIPEGIDQMSSEELLQEDGYFLVNFKYILYNGKVNDFGIQNYVLTSVYNSLLLILYLLPVYILLFYNFKAFKNRRGFEGIFAKVSPFCLIIILFSYMEVDYGRWNSCLILSLILGLLSALLINPEKSWISHIPEKYRELVCEGIVILMILVPNMGVWA